MRALSSLTSPAAAESREALLAVPLGATEQHGPHLPLTTDTEVAVALVTRLAANHPGVVAGPPVAYGASGEHETFPGTVSIGHDALVSVLIELGRSASSSFARLLFVNAHGGNAAALSAAVARLRHEARDVAAWSPAWGLDAHAGRAETSLMLALAPERVRLADAVAGNVEPVASLLGAMRAGGGVAAVSPNGVLGDPAGASAQEGRALLDAAGARLAAFVREWPAAVPANGAARAG